MLLQGEQPKERRLAGAVSPEERVDGTTLDRERDVVERPRAPVADGDALECRGDAGAHRGGNLLT